MHFLRQVTVAVSSAVVFNTDGTLTSTHTDTEIRNTTTGRVGVTTNTCSGTWTFDAAPQQLSTTSTCTFATTIGGDSTGTSVVHTTYSLAGTTLVRVQPLTPEVVIVNVQTGANAPFSFQHVCGGSQTLFFVK